VGDEREIELGNAAASIAARYGISGSQHVYRRSILGSDTFDRTKSEQRLLASLSDIGAVCAYFSWAGYIISDAFHGSKICEREQLAVLSDVRAT